MKNRSMAMATLVGTLTGTLLGAGTFYYAQLMSYDVVSASAVSQEMSLRNYVQGQYEVQTRGGTVRDRNHSSAPDPLTQLCKDLSGSRYTKCMGNAQEGIRYRQY